MTLRGSAQPLTSSYDVALLDLDGVVYLGERPVEHAAESLTTARARGMRLEFVTNNAARTPASVAERLDRLGVPATAAEIVTSAQAAAHYLADRLPPGARVLVVGTTGLVEALAERGLTPVHSADDEPAAVVQGYSPDTDWRMLAEGALAIQRDLPWVATNADATLPSVRGPLPGNGSLVAALRHATGREPVVTGKPDPTMHRETVERSRASRPLIVGDRLDTDIEGACAVGCPSLLVLTGVTGPAELLAAPPGQRPDYLGCDLRGLLTAHPEPEIGAEGGRCGGWQASGDVLSGEGDELDALRALCVASWAGDTAPRWRPRGDAAARALSALGL